MASFGALFLLATVGEIESFTSEDTEEHTQEVPSDLLFSLLPGQKDLTAKVAKESRRSQRKSAAAAVAIYFTSDFTEGDVVTIGFLTSAFHGFGFGGALGLTPKSQT